MLLSLTSDTTSDPTYQAQVTDTKPPQTVTGLAQYAALAGVTEPTGNNPATLTPAAGSDSVSTFLATLGQDATQAGRTYTAISNAVDGNAGPVPQPPTIGGSGPAPKMTTEGKVVVGALALLAALVVVSLVKR